MLAPPHFKRGQQAHLLLKIAAVCTLRRSTSGHDVATVPHGPFAQNTYPLDSPDLRRWMVHSFRAETGVPPTANALNAVLQSLHAEVQFGSTTCAPGTRLIPGPADTVVLDLADPQSQCIEISKDGWQPADSGNHAFERTPGTGPLPTPETAPDPQALERLRTLLNIPIGASWTRTLTWLTAALRPSGSYPILILRGPSGAGKTTAARLLRTLLDPVQTPLETLPATPTQWEAAAARHRILACDDVDRIPPAAVSTLAKIADQSTPVILVLSSQFTGAIPEQIAQRSLIVDLTPAQNVRTLFSLRREFDTLHPHVLGTLCTAVSRALRGFEATAEMTYPRLADAAAWACAAAPALDQTDAAIRAAIAAIPEPAAEHPAPPNTKHKTAASSAPARPAPTLPGLPQNLEHAILFESDPPSRILKRPHGEI
jgi:hypothetical protein